MQVIRCQRIGEERRYEEIEIEIPVSVYRRFDNSAQTNQQHRDGSKSIKSKYEQLKRRFAKI
jgi:hypothetical protein